MSAPQKKPTSNLEPITGAIAQLEELFLERHVLPSDAKFPCSYGYAGQMALGKNDGQAAVDRTWLKNLESAAEIAGFPQFAESLTVVPHGNKLPKITKLGFLALRDIGLHCDRRRIVLDDAGQIVPDENGTPQVEKNRSAIAISEYALNHLKPVLAEVYDVADEPEAFSVESEVFVEPSIYQPSEERLRPTTSGLAQYQARMGSGMQGIEETMEIAQKLSKASENRADEAYTANQANLAMFYRTNQRLSAQLAELAQNLSEQATQEGRNLGAAIVQGAEGKRNQAAIEEVARYLEQQSGEIE